VTLGTRFAERAAGSIGGSGGAVQQGQHFVFTRESSPSHPSNGFPDRPFSAEFLFPMDRATAIGIAAAAFACMLAVARLFSRSRRRRDVKLGVVSQQWLSEHVDDVRD
jgi:hypothetical protein